MGLSLLGFLGALEEKQCALQLDLVLCWDHTSPVQEEDGGSFWARGSLEGLIISVAIASSRVVFL